MTEHSTGRDQQSWVDIIIVDHGCRRSGGDEWRYTSAAASSQPRRYCAGVAGLEDGGCGFLHIPFSKRSKSWVCRSHRAHGTISQERCASKKRSTREMSIRHTVWDIDNACHFTAPHGVGVKSGWWQTRMFPYMHTEIAKWSPP